MEEVRKEAERKLAKQRLFRGIDDNVGRFGLNLRVSISVILRDATPNGAEARPNGE